MKSLFSDGVVCGTSPLKQTQKSRDRLTLKSEFAQVRDQARKQVCSLAVMLYIGAEKDGLNSPSDHARCGVICSRKFDKRAVRRNRARRLLYESFRLAKQDLLPCRIIFIPRRPILSRKMPEVSLQLKNLYRKAGLLRTSPESI